MIKHTVRFKVKHYANVSRMHSKAHLMHLKAFLYNCIQRQTTGSTGHAMHYHTSMLTHRDINTSHAGQYLQLWQVSQFLSSTENQLCALWLQKLEKKGGVKKKGYKQASHIFPLSKSSQFTVTSHNHPKARHNNWTLLASLLPSTNPGISVDTTKAISEHNVLLPAHSCLQQPLTYTGWTFKWTA